MGLIIKEGGKEITKNLENFINSVRYLLDSIIENYKTGITKLETVQELNSSLGLGLTLQV